MTKPMSVTIYGPNLPRSLSARGSLVVHATGCADTQRSPYTRLSADSPAWSIEATTRAEVVETIYDPSDFDYDPSDPEARDPYDGDVYFFPCVDLP